MLFSILLLSELLTTVDELRVFRSATFSMIAELERELDKEMFLRLLAHAVELRPKVARDGLGLTELEFTLTMLLELNRITIAQLRPFIKQFRKLDVDRSGRLGLADLKIIEETNPELLAEMRRKHAEHEGKTGVIGLSANTNSVAQAAHSAGKAKAKPGTSEATEAAGQEGVAPEKRRSSRSQTCASFDQSFSEASQPRKARALPMIPRRGSTGMGYGGNVSLRNLHA
jgi:hypothetical protein